MYVERVSKNLYNGGENSHGQRGITMESKIRKRQGGGGNGQNREYR